MKNLFYIFILIFCLFYSCSDNSTNPTSNILLSIDSAYIHAPLDSLHGIGPTPVCMSTTTHWTGSKFHISYFVFTNDISDSNSFSTAYIRTPVNSQLESTTYYISRIGHNNNGLIDTTFIFSLPINIGCCDYYINFQHVDSSAYLYIKNLKIEKLN